VPNTYLGQTLIVEGTLTIGSAEAISSSAAVSVSTGATLQLNGGMDVETVPLQLGGSGVGSNGALVVLNGASTWGGPISLSSDTTVSVAASSDSLTLTNSITENLGGAGLTKTGSGLLILAASAQASYSGTTTVQSGRLQVDGTVTGAVQTAGGTVTGTGTIQGGVTVAKGDTFGAGDATNLTGTLTVGSAASPANVTLASGSTFHVDFSGKSKSSSLVVNGNVSLGGATLAGLIDPSFTSAVGDVFTLITCTGSLTGSFEGLADGATVTLGGVSFTIHYTGNSVTLKRK
jgi:autotransporter-associated beta strand protein